MIFTFLLFFSPRVDWPNWASDTHAASGVCGGPLTMASSKHHSESEENVLDWSSTHWHSFDLIPFYHCPTKGDILNWTQQNNIRTNMTATILVLLNQFCSSWWFWALDLTPWDVTSTALGHTKLPPAVKPKQHFDRWLHLQKQNRSPLVPPSPPTTQPLVSCFRLNRPQTGDRPLVLLLSSYGPVGFSWNAYELHYEQEQASFAMLPAPKSGPSSLGAFVTYHIWYQGIIDIYS